MTLNPLPPNAPDYGALLNSLLDDGYQRAAAPVLNALLTDTQRGMLKRRLDEVEAEAQRLADLGQQLKPDNAVWRALAADFDDAMRVTARNMANVADDVALTGAQASVAWLQQTTLPGFTDEMLQGIGFQWNRVDPQAIVALVDYTGSEAWEAELAKFGEDAADVLRNVAIRGVVNGRNPLAIAREARDMVNGYPAARANSLLRTLQLQSYRAGTVENYKANADILEPYAIRLANLDDRCCLFCVSEHGKRVPIDTPIQTHHACRCTTIAVVRGRPREIQTGEDWFNSLDESRQRELAGSANYNALKAGAVKLSDFRQEYHDDLFGDMAHEASLVSILGDEAEQYYTR